MTPENNKQSGSISTSNQKKPGRVVMVASGKGGVGKTWFSITFAHGLSEKNRKVLLFDGDLGLANVDIQLGLMPERDLGGVVLGHFPLEEAVIPCESGQFDIIAGRSGCGSLASLSHGRLAHLRESLKHLAQTYDVVVMDLGAGVGGTVQALSHIADECMVVITDEPTSLTDAYAFIKVTLATRSGLPIGIVVNQAETPEAGRRIYETLRKVCENFLKFSPDLVGIIRRDHLVRDTIRNQTPLLKRHAGSNAAMDVRTIVRHQLPRAENTQGFYHNSPPGLVKAVQV